MSEARIDVGTRVVIDFISEEANDIVCTLTARPRSEGDTYAFVMDDGQRFEVQRFNDMWEVMEGKKQ